MTSNILSFSRSVTGLGRCDGNVQIAPAINIPVNRSDRSIRVLSASVSSNIPNVFTTNDFSNARCNVSRDDGASWKTVVLPNGIYSVAQLSAAINSACAEDAWWTDASDAGFTIGVNLVTDYLWMRVDSTKLAVAGQLRIDFAESSMNELTGFMVPHAFIVDGLYSANAAAQMDWFGNRVSVLVSGFGAISYKNNDESYEICTIPLSSSATVNEYLFPLEGTVSPHIRATGISNTVRSYGVSFIGSRLNADGSPRQLYIFDGDVSLYLELRF
jgi:hypothetical protein